MASSPVFKQSEGEDFEVRSVSRASNATHRSVLKIDGTTGSVTVLGDFGGTGVPALKVDGTTGVLSGYGITDSATWTKDSADGSASTATSEHTFFRAAQALTITAVNYVPDGTLTSGDTNYATLTVKSRTAAGGSATTVASQTTKTSGSSGSGDWAAFTAVPLTTVAGTLSLTAGQVLTIGITKAASGVTVPAGLLQVDFILN